MKRKIIGIFVCMLVIGTTIPSIGAITLPTRSLIMEHLSSELLPTTPPDSPGNPIGIRVRAEVVNISDSSNVLQGKIKIGDKITGKYIYDAETPNAYPGYPNLGYYIMNYTPCGVEFTVGGLTFKTDPNNPLTVVVIANDYQYPPEVIDAMEVLSIVDSSLSQNLLCYAYVSFWDKTATALSSIELPTTAPVLKKWEDKTLNIIGIDYSTYSFFIVQANITLAFKQYGANLQGVKGIVRQSLTTIPTIVTPLFMRFMSNVVARFPHAFPRLRHRMGY
jgi:hypothetical protein